MNFRKRLEIILEGGQTDPTRILYVINAILSTNDDEQIATGFKTIYGMDEQGLMGIMAKSEPDMSYLENWLTSKPSNIRKLIPIFEKFGEEALDFLIDKAMTKTTGEGDYDEEGEFYYNQGDDDGGH